MDYYFGFCSNIQSDEYDEYYLEAMAFEEEVND